MKPTSLRQTDAAASTVIFMSLYMLEFSALLIGMAVYKKGDRSLLNFLVAPPGFVFLFAVLLLATSALVIVRRLRNGLPPATKGLIAPLILNLWSVGLILATAEVVIRLFTVGTPTGQMFASTPMLPRSWESVAALNRTILAKASAQGSYFVYDNLLGWTVGRSRRSESGLYLSSAEGIRSPRTGMTFASVHPKRRIAIVGDSFTFGLEIPYEDTWGYKLEQGLGSGFQVLNFGVDGYGVDQAYLRYQRDVRSWHPDIVIFGVINDDIRRAMGVYGFLTFPNAAMPFPKPRFVLRGGALELLNTPLPTPDYLFAKESITQLPFIEYDQSFHPMEWQWRFYYHAYSVRFLLSRYPQWPVLGPHVSYDAMRSLNLELLRAFLRLAREAGSTPIVVYFPQRSDFKSDQTHEAKVGLERVAAEILQSNGIPYIDMTPCVKQVSPAERYVKIHYSPVANAAIAKCLVNSIGEAPRG
jgi:GDSL-like Lipase/Acylhydrolase family